jgi:hypothetical protein
MVAPPRRAHAVPRPPMSARCLRSPSSSAGPPPVAAHRDPARELSPCLRGALESGEFRRRRSVAARQGCSPRRSSLAAMRAVFSAPAGSGHPQARRMAASRNARSISATWTTSTSPTTRSPPAPVRPPVGAGPTATTACSADQVGPEGDPNALLAGVEQVRGVLEPTALERGELGDSDVVRCSSGRQAIGAAPCASRSIRPGARRAGAAGTRAVAGDATPPRPGGRGTVGWRRPGCRLAVAPGRRASWALTTNRVMSPAGVPAQTSLAGAAITSRR